MMTTMRLPIDTTENWKATCLEEKNPAPQIGESLRLYVPQLMVKIKNAGEDPKKIPIGTKGISLFCNHPDCRPSTKSMITGQNYLVGKMENNNVWSHVAKTYNQRRPTSRLEGYDIVTGAPIVFHYNHEVYYTVKGEQLECHALNGKLNKLMFNTSKYVE